MGNLLIYSAAEIFCIWPRALPRRRWRRELRGRKPIRRGRCALRARGDRKCKTPPRSDICRGGVLCSVRERTSRELLRLTNRANSQ